MKNEQTSQDLDDIVFEGKNKKYGAYMLRKIYGSHISKALLYSSIVFTLTLVGPGLYAELMPKAEDDDAMAMKEVTLAPPPPIDPNTPPPPPLPPPPPPPKVSTVRFVPPEPVPEEEVPADEEPPPVEELKDKVVANATVEGDPNATDEIIAPTEDTGAGQVVDLPKKEEPFTVVEQMPSFPGGMEQLMRFLSKNMKYPAQAQRNNIEGSVYVQFVVDAQGNISEVKVLKGIEGGYGLDEEAVRVVSKMPAWTPGKQAGRAVPVRYTLPIKFKLNQ